MNEMKPHLAEQVTCSAKAELAEVDVMRALECCMNGGRCNKCPIYDESECECYLGEKVLALLREKDALIADYIRQIAEMQAQIATQDSELTALMKCKHIEADKDAEIERLTAYNANLICANTDITNRHKDYVEEAQRAARAEAVTEFAERVLALRARKSNFLFVVSKGNIDHIAKELKEEGHGEK